MGVETDWRFSVQAIELTASARGARLARGVVAGSGWGATTFRTTKGSNDSRIMATRIAKWTPTPTNRLTTL